MQRLVVAARLAARRRASSLEVHLPKVPVEFTDEEVEFCTYALYLATLQSELRIPSEKLTASPAAALPRDDGVALERPNVRRARPANSRGGKRQRLVAGCVIADAQVPARVGALDGAGDSEVLAAGLGAHDWDRGCSGCTPWV